MLNNFTYEELLPSSAQLTENTYKRQAKRIEDLERVLRRVINVESWRGAKNFEETLTNALVGAERVLMEKEG